MDDSEGSMVSQEEEPFEDYCEDPFEGEAGDEHPPELPEEDDGRQPADGLGATQEADPLGPLVSAEEAFARYAKATSAGQGRRTKDAQAAVITGRVRRQEQRDEEDLVMLAEAEAAGRWGSVAALRLLAALSLAVADMKAIGGRIALAERKLNNASWQARVEKATEQGAAKAHRWMKEAAPELVKVDDAGLPSDREDQLLRGDTEAWKALWCCGPGPADETWWEPARWPECVVDRPADAEQIREAALAFSPGTAVVDGWHPRQFGGLSQACREGLPKLFFWFEVSGLWPRRHHDLLVKMLPKPSGGFRPICLYRSMYRLWSRLRATAIKERAAQELSHPAFNNMAGRRATDAAWRTLVRQLGRGPSETHAVEIAWDVKKMFDHVRRDKLYGAAVARRYPLSILRVSLLSYGWQRRLVTTSGIVSEGLWPSRGIAPGSAFAVYEAALVMATGLLRCVADLPPGGVLAARRRLVAHGLRQDHRGGHEKRAAGRCCVQAGHRGGGGLAGRQGQGHRGRHVAQVGARRLARARAVRRLCRQAGQEARRGLWPWRQAREQGAQAEGAGRPPAAEAGPAAGD